jgi:hypothetical protein
MSENDEPPAKIRIDDGTIVVRLINLSYKLLL